MLLLAYRLVIISRCGLWSLLPTFELLLPQTAGGGLRWGKLSKVQLDLLMTCLILWSADYHSDSVIVWLAVGPCYDILDPYNHKSRSKPIKQDVFVVRAIKLLIKQNLFNYFILYKNLTHYFGSKKVTCLFSWFNESAQKLPNWPIDIYIPKQKVNTYVDEVEILAGFIMLMLYSA